MFSLLAVFAVLIGISVLPSSAAPSAYPPTPGRTLSASTTRPVPGGQETISGTGWTPGAVVTITIHSKVIYLGTTKVAANGAFSISVRIPTCLSGNHTLIASSSAGIYLSFPIFIAGHATTSCDAAPAGAPATPATGSGKTSGGLPFTGVDVYALGGLSALLMLAGGILLVSGRRRRPITA